MHPVTSFEYSVPIWQISMLADNAEEFTPFTLYFGFYSLADEVFGGYLEHWEITVINRQQKSCYELWHCEVVRAFADAGNSNLIDES
jgi:hypothetical protein